MSYTPEQIRNYAKGLSPEEIYLEATKRGVTPAQIDEALGLQSGRAQQWVDNYKGSLPINYTPLSPDRDLFEGDFTDPMVFEWMGNGQNTGMGNDPNAVFSFDNREERVAEGIGRVFGGQGGEGGRNPAAFLNPATAIISLISGIDKVKPVTWEDMNRSVGEWVALNSRNPDRKPIPDPGNQTGITINQEHGYIRRDDMTREQIETEIRNGQLAVWTNPDGSRVVLDKEGFYQDYPVEESGGGGGGGSSGGASGGGAGSGSPGGGQSGEPTQGEPSGGGDIDVVVSDEYVYPNEKIIAENAYPVREYQNPDGSTVVEYSDGSTQWGQAPTETPPEYDLEGPYSREQILTHTEGMSWPEVYDAFIKFGVPIADANKVFGWEPGTTEAWVEANVPSKGEDVIVADPAKDTGGQSPGGSVPMPDAASISDPAPDFGEDFPGDSVPMPDPAPNPTPDPTPDPNPNPGPGGGGVIGDPAPDGGGSGDGTGEGPGDGPGEGPGDGSVTLEQILSPTRTTDALFAPELEEFKRGRLIQNLLSYYR